MKAGRLDKRIRIQELTHSRDTGGGDVPTWTTVTNGDRWAEIMPLSGNESYVGQQLQGVVTHKVTTRYLAGVTNKNRIFVVNDSRVFDIHHAINWGERERELSMLCTERKATD